MTLGSSLSPLFLPSPTSRLSGNVHKTYPEPIGVIPVASHLGSLLLSLPFFHLILNTAAEVILLNVNQTTLTLIQNSMTSHITIQFPPTSHELSVLVSYYFQSPDPWTSLMLPRLTGLSPLGLCTWFSPLLPASLYSVSPFAWGRPQAHYSHSLFHFSPQPSLSSSHFNYLSGFSLATHPTTTHMHTERPQST